VRRLAWLFLGVALALLLAPDVMAQSPFGVGPRSAPPPPPPPDGVMGWIMAQQSAFYREINQALRAARADGSMAWGLIGLSIAYGVFHAAGPGHGKAVISSYLVADNQSWRRGVILSFVSAAVQALTAIVLIGTLFALFNMTTRVLDQTVRWIEMAAYGLIVLVGLRLVWVKGRALMALTGGGTVALAGGGGPVVHVHADGTACDGSCGHAHGPDPELVRGEGGWQRGLAAVFAVGVRPCTGALVVLTFALAQGMIWTGIASVFAMAFGTAVTVAVIATLAVFSKGLAVRLAGSRPGGGVVLMRVVEVLAALAVVAFGLLLLGGIWQTERLLPM
jgi:nickel/cobalt exporter